MLAAKREAACHLTVWPSVAEEGPAPPTKATIVQVHVTVCHFRTFERGDTNVVFLRSTLSAAQLVSTPLSNCTSHIPLSVGVNTLLLLSSSQHSRWLTSSPCRHPCPLQPMTPTQLPCHRPASRPHPTGSPHASNHILPHDPRSHWHAVFARHRSLPPPRAPHVHLSSRVHVVCAVPFVLLCSLTCCVLTQTAGVLLSEVLPKAGLVYSEKGNLSELLCKPKLMPLKSVSMQKIEQMEQRMQEKIRAQQQQQQ